VNLLSCYSKNAATVFDDVAPKQARFSMEGKAAACRNYIAG
jgi:hypothetical protein